MNTIGTLLLGLGLIVGVVTAFTNKLRYFGLVILAVTISLISFHLWQAHQWTVEFDSAQIGMPARIVTSLLGDPQRVTDGSEMPVPSVKKSADQMTPRLRKGVLV
jgi:dipeptide/tripeptide permease